MFCCEMRNVLFEDQKNRDIKYYKVSGSFVLPGQYVECNSDSAIGCVYVGNVL
jgi:hypothetical protein